MNGLFLRSVAEGSALRLAGSSLAVGPWRVATVLEARRAGPPNTAQAAAWRVPHLRRSVPFGFGPRPSGLGYIERAGPPGLKCRSHLHGTDHG